eukprot:COSAG01_NODE_2548_length_7465_cov_15.046294_8_plen_90_part_00
MRAFRGFAGALKQKGADVIILGCTEIPLALPEPEYDGVPLVDPVEAVARAMIAMADPAKLKPPIQPHEQVCPPVAAGGGATRAPPLSFG